MRRRLTIEGCIVLPVVCAFSTLSSLDPTSIDIDIECRKNCQISFNIALVSDRFQKLVWTYPYIHQMSVSQLIFHVYIYNQYYIMVIQCKSKKHTIMSPRHCHILQTTIRFVYTILCAAKNTYLIISIKRRTSGPGSNKRRVYMVKI